MCCRYFCAPLLWPPMGSHCIHPFRRQLGDRLRELRQAAGELSQEQLAAMAGVHRTYVGRLERGESGVTVEMLATILNAMDRSLQEFFQSFERPVATRTPRKRD